MKRQPPSPGFLLALAAIIIAYLLLLDFHEFCTPAYKNFCSRVLDVAHAPIFFGLAIVIWVAIKKPFAAALISSLVAGLIEIVQPMFGRSASVIDWVDSSIGAVFGAWLIVLLKKQELTKMHIAEFVGSGVIAVLFMFVPAYQEWKTLDHLYSNFPILLDFNDESELRLVWANTRYRFQDTTIQLVPHHAKYGGRALQVTAGDRFWSGVTINVGDTDWTPYQTLVIELVNTGEPFQLYVRIDDSGDVNAFNSRFNKELAVATGRNRFEISIDEMVRTKSGRLFKLEEIQRLSLFIDKEDRARVFYLDAVYLE